MDGSVGLPVAANWEQWAQGGFMPPLGAGSGPTGPLASTPGAPPAIDPATPAGAGALSPATLNQTTPAPLPALDYAGDSPAGPAAPQTSVSDVGNRVSGLVKKAQDYFNPTVSSAPVAPAPEAPPTPKAPVLAAAQASMPPAGVDRNGTPPAVAPPTPGPVAATAPAQAGPVAATAPAQAGPVAPATPADYGTLASIIVPAESGGRDVKNPNSSASGPGQFIDSTWKAFIDSPANTGKWTMADKGNPAAVAAAIPWYASVNDGIFRSTLGRPATQDELLASHMFGGAGAAALAANPTANAYDVLQRLDPNTVADVFKNNATVIRPTMSAGDALASTANYFHTGKGSASMVAGTGTTAAGPAAGASPPAPTAATPPPYTPLEMPFDPASLTMPRGSGLLALASGLLSGPNFSQGLGKGLQAMNNVTAQDLQSKREANTQTQAINSANYRNQYMQAMLGIKEAPKQFGTPILSADGKTMLQGMRDGAGNVTYQPLPGTTTAQQRATTNQQAMTNRFDPVVKANMAQGAESGKDAAEDIAAIQNSTAADMQSLAETQQARALIAKNPEMMGPTLQARATRSLAELGIAGDPNTLNAIQKMTAENRNTYLSSLTGGHVGGIRSNQELKNLSQAVADIGTSPAAADWIIQLQQRQLQQKMAWRDELNRRQTEDPQSVIGSNYLRTKSEFAKSYFTENPIPDYTGGMAAPNASAAPAQHGPVTQVLHYDAQGNQIK